MHFHPVFAVLVAPLLLIFGLLSIPYVNHETETSGVWFCSHKGRKMALIAAAVAIFVTTSGVLLDELVLGVNMTGPPTMITNGLLPFAVVLTACGGFYFLMKKRFKANNNEAIQALFTLLTTSFVVLTLIGIWFRGAGMQLMWAG